MSNFLWAETEKNKYQNLVFFKAFRWIVHKGLPFEPFLLSLFWIFAERKGGGELVFWSMGNGVRE
jgi:hypothetical protein